MIIAVGSTNPTKMLSVQTVFSKHFSPLKVQGVSVSSGVSEQPMSDDETFQGALNRAQKALKEVENAQFGVGIEGGLQQYEYGWFERGLVVITDTSGAIGIGSSGGIVLPPQVIAAILQGKTLEAVMDSFFGTKQVGEGIGAFGLLTNEVVTRTTAMEHGVAFALGRFLHPDLY